MNQEEIENKFTQELLNAKEDVENQIKFIDTEIKKHERDAKKLEYLKKYSKYRLDRIKAQILLNNNMKEIENYIENHKEENV